MNKESLLIAHLSDEDKSYYYKWFKNTYTLDCKKDKTTAFIFGYLKKDDSDLIYDISKYAEKGYSCTIRKTTEKNFIEYMTTL